MTLLSEDNSLLREVADLTTAGAILFGGAMASASDALVPKVPQDIVKWSRENLTLPTSVSARSGPLELSPLQAAIARLWQTPGVRQVTFIKPTRFGSSLLNAAGLLYFAGHEGLDVIFYERSEGDCQDFHDKKLFPILLESPTVAAMKRPDTKAGIQDSWTDRILKNGASIQLRSASNNGSFRAIKGAFICVDEAGAKEYRDRSKNSEGSKLSLIRRRAQEYAAPVIYLGGTPTKSGECMVTAEHSRSIKHSWFMPCPCCGAEILWEPDVRQQIDPEAHYGPGIRYSLDERGIIVDVWYECGECGDRIRETEKIAMMEAGVLRPTGDGVGEEGHYGVHAWGAHSTDPQMTWRHIASEHLAAIADPELMAPFYNTVLGLPYDRSPVARLEATKLESRKQKWSADAPSWVDMIFMGIDVQQGSWEDQSRPPRIEATIMGLGRNQRRAVLDHRILAGIEELNPHTGKVEFNPVKPFASTASYRMLWDLLSEEFTTEDGRKLRIRRTAVDYGFAPEAIQQWLDHPTTRSFPVFPVRSSWTDQKEDRKPVLPANLDLARQRRRGRLIGRDFLEVGANRVKDELADCLARDLPAPKSIEFAAHLPREYFDGLLAETLVEIEPGLTVWKNMNKKKSTGEPWDCMVYTYAAEHFEMRQNDKLKALYYRVDPAAEAQAQAAKLAREAREADLPVPEQPIVVPPVVADPRFTAERVGRRRRSSDDAGERGSAADPSRLERLRNRIARRAVAW